jgi:hypothetical protein
MSAENHLIPLINAIDKDVTYFEIGVLKAENLVALVGGCPNIKEIVGIDSYKAYVDSLVAIYSVSYEGSQYNKEVAEKAIVNSSHPEKIKLWVIDSDEAALQTEDKSIDVVFLDAQVTVGQTAKDVLAWHPKVKGGGILCGHDWYCKGVQKEVYEALEALGYVKEDVTILGNEVWWIRKNK